MQRLGSIQEVQVYQRMALDKGLEEDEYEHEGHDSFNPTGSDECMLTDE